jgi:hypothetical protein
MTLAMDTGLDSLVRTYGRYEVGLSVTGAICCYIEEMTRRCIVSRVLSVVESQHLVVAKFDV